MKEQKCVNVGGQAVLEGVMMRSPNSFVVAVRQPNKKIIVKEDKWVSLSNRFPFLKWPFLRGNIVLIEALVNGIQALTFSANHAFEESQEEQMSLGGTILMILVSFILAFTIFMILPHVITIYFNKFLGIAHVETSLAFHIVDGFFKVLFLVAYVAAISISKDIRRVFEYHGAEHKAIYTYEAKQELTVENAKKFTTLHPRCGTSFLLVFLLASIFIFSFLYPFLPAFENHHFVVQKAIFIFIKLPLIFPIAGIAYEFIRFSGKHRNNPLLRIFILPGLLLQKITTREPSDDQIEVALISLKQSLWIEEQKEKVEKERIFEVENMSDPKLTSTTTTDETCLQS